jgi:DNA-binding transcriptional MerR regulator
MEHFTDTTGSLARQADTTVPTVRLYADLGLLDYVLASNGTRLFRTGQADRVRQIYRERLARRSSRHRAA